MRIPKEMLFLLTLFTWGCITSQPIYQAKTSQSGDAIASEQALYDSAVYYFRQKQYSQSERLFVKITADYPAGEAAQKSAYMAGYLFTIADNPNKNYAAAKERFELFRKQFPKSRYRSDSESWIAVINELESLRTGVSSSDCDSVAANNKSMREEIKKLNIIIEQLQASQKK